MKHFHIFITNFMLLILLERVLKLQCLHTPYATKQYIIFHLIYQNIKCWQNIGNFNRQYVVVAAETHAYFCRQPWHTLSLSSA